MALRAADVEVGRVRSNGRSPLDFLATQSANWRSVTDYERTLLAVVAGGGNPYSFGGVDLVAKVRAYQGPAGNIGDAVNSNAFGILAYKAAGVAVPPGAVQWQKSVQNPDGGWGNSPGAASNPDMTAASVMALRAGGVPCGDPAIEAALAYLHAIQNPDGGFSFQSPSSDAAATAWCVQALTSVGQDPAGAAWSKNGNTPLGFLRSMQAPDGRFFWMQGREMNPLWVTSYATCALMGKPFPVAVHAGSALGDAGNGQAVPAVPGGVSGGAVASPTLAPMESASPQAEATQQEASTDQPEEEVRDTEVALLQEGVPDEETAEASDGIHWLLWMCMSMATATILSLTGYFFLKKKGVRPPHAEVGDVKSGR